MATPAAAVHSIETRHTDMIVSLFWCVVSALWQPHSCPLWSMQHDAQFDYYAKRLATASSDGTVTVYDVSGSEHRESAVLSGCVLALSCMCAPARVVCGRSSLV